MNRALAILAPVLVVLGGCLSAPVPQDLIPVQEPPPPPPLLLKEVVRLSRAGISDGTIVSLIRTRGIVNRPSLEGARRLKEEGVRDPVILTLLGSTPVERMPKPRPRIVYRDLYIPLWPSYSRGRWHFGLRMAGYYRISPEGAMEEYPEEPEYTLPPPPPLIDP